MVKKRSTAENNLTQARALIKECQENQSPYLDLGNCGITDLNNLPKLFECTHLETLILSNSWWSFEVRNKINSCNKGQANKLESIPSEIANLDNLMTLIISGDTSNEWEISNYSFLEKLARLRSLDISYNEISDISFLEKLTGLQSLNLDDNKISDISVLEKLTRLQYLNLYNNKISDISFLEKLTKLQYLDIRSREISDISVLEKLTGLQSLNLNANKISDISFLEKLTGLQHLNLVGLEASDISFLEKLTGLQYLNLSNNKISDFSFLEKLTGLQHLTLSNNKISDFSFLEKLTGLQHLDLFNNEISDISFLEKLTGLQHLTLSNNKISDISVLEKLTGLETLDLQSNNISEIPLSVFRLGMEINLENYGEGLSLYENPLESPPMEILKQGRQSVLDWFEATKVKLNEIKIILIGDPKAGKTSLLRRLKDGSFDENEVQTDGVNIEDIHFGECDTFKKQTSIHKLTGHFWDFGGQEIMNATHQFFLTSRSVYILVLDARKDANVSAQIRQWIKRIKTTGGHSSIIIVANQIDVNSGFGFENEYELQEEFPQVKYFIKASCNTKQNIDLIKDKLEVLIPQAELFNTRIDERWISIKEELQKETKTKHFLDENRFLQVCKKFKLKETREQRNAINFLHDLGLVLHFEDINLSEYYILEPYWITYGVYQILTSAYAGKMKGVVSMNKLEFIVNEEEDKEEKYLPANYRKIHYTNNQRRFLVDILNQFKLCFYLPDRSYFIIPDLLDTKQPKEITEPIKNAEDSIRFVYEYAYLPKSTMPHIMVETHHILLEKWRTGCVLHSNGCKALVTNYQNRISIIVNGGHKKKREFMAIIRYLIDSINQELSDKPNMLIPLPGTNAYKDYEELLEREKDGEKYYTLYKPTKKRFEISKLLEGVPSQDEVIKMSDKIDILLDKVNEIKHTLDSHYEYLINLPVNQKIRDDIFDAIKEMKFQQSVEITEEIIQGIATAIDQSKGELDNRLTEIYADLKKSDDVQMKLKLAVPFINLLGINLETEFDIKNWAKKLYKKHELKIFKLMGYL
jgi:internalin A